MPSLAAEQPRISEVEPAEVLESVAFERLQSMMVAIFDAARVARDFAHSFGRGISFKICKLIRICIGMRDRVMLTLEGGRLTAVLGDAMQWRLWYL